MQTAIIRDLVLVVAGNSLIQENTVRRFWPDYEIFRYSKECVFVDGNGALLAPDPNAWLETIQQNYDGLWLDYTAQDRGVPDRMTQGFVGGGRRWLIGAVRGATTELWEGGDDLGDKNDPTGKIWNSGYVRVSADWKEKRDPGHSIAEMKAALDETLQKIGGFARQQQRNNFAESFEAARAALTGRPVRDPMFRHGELGRDAAQLWQAVGAAWVFGGMGSWNDIVFEGADHATYEQLSEELYTKLNEATAAVANSTWPKYRMPSKEGTTWWQRLFMKIPPATPPPS